jgi:transposase-like protein
MICPECQASNLKKNGPKRGKQNYFVKTVAICLLIATRP